MCWIFFPITASIQLLWFAATKVWWFLGFVVLQSTTLAIWAAYPITWGVTTLLSFIAWILTPLVFLLRALWIGAWYICFPFAWVLYWTVFFICAVFVRAWLSVTATTPVPVILLAIGASPFIVQNIAMVAALMDRFSDSKFASMHEKRVAAVQAWGNFMNSWEGRDQNLLKHAIESAKTVSHFLWDWTVMVVTETFVAPVKALKLDDARLTIRAIFESVESSASMSGASNVKIPTRLEKQLELPRSNHYTDLQARAARWCQSQVMSIVRAVRQRVERPPQLAPAVVKSISGENSDRFLDVLHEMLEDVDRGQQLEALETIRAVGSAPEQHPMNTQLCRSVQIFARSFAKKHGQDLVEALAIGRKEDCKIAAAQAVDSIASTCDEARELLAEEDCIEQLEMVARQASCASAPYAAKALVTLLSDEADDDQQDMLMEVMLALQDRQGEGWAAISTAALDIACLLLSSYLDSLTPRKTLRVIKTVCLILGKPKSGPDVLRKGIECLCELLDDDPDCFENATGRVVPALLSVIEREHSDVGKDAADALIKFMRDSGDEIGPDVKSELSRGQHLSRLLPLMHSRQSVHDVLVSLLEAPA